eukprot:jgi/Tetstr1/436908/TSEL_025681.t1
MAALFVALDELLPYVPAANQDFTPYLARARNHAEAIDKAFRFRLAFLRRLNEIKRVHGDQGVLDVLRAQHFQPASEHLGSAIFGDLMKDYERRVFEATVARSAKATATARVAAAAAGRGRGRGRGGGRGRGREAINAFFTDNFKEPPALGPFVNQAMRGWELAQQVLDAPDYRPSQWRGVRGLGHGRPYAYDSLAWRLKVGSGVVLNYIVPCIMDSAGARFFFGSLAPQRSVANLSQ